MASHYHNNYVIVFEKIHNAVTVSSLRGAIKSYLPLYIHKNHNDNIKHNKVRLEINPIASNEFLDEIASLKGISLLKTIVHKEKITSDEDLIFSGSNCRDDAELIYKPNPKEKLFPSDVVKYCKAFISNGRIKNEKVKEELKKMKSTEKGYVNDNNQRNNGRTNKPGTDYGQWFYEMECLNSNCGHKYYANGTDIWLRKCPKCQGGRP